VDTDSGLQWLDLTASDNRSVNDVTANLGVGGDYEGFRYATVDEVLELFVNANIPDVSGTSAANVGPAQALMDFIGSTNFEAGVGDGREALGALEDGTVVALQGFDSNGEIVMTAGVVGSQGLAFSTPQVGHWLVVPEPASLAVLMLGAMVWVGRRVR